MYTILDSNLKPCGILDLNGIGCKFYNDIRSTKIADEQGKIWLDTLELSVPYGYRETTFMTNGYHLLKEGSDGRFYCYRIYSPEDSAIGPVHVRKIKALNLLAWDLGHRIVPAKTLENATTEQAFDYILQKSGWELGEVDFLGGGKVEFSAGNNAQYWLDQLTKSFSVEIRAHVQVYNGKIIRKIVDVVEELGEQKLHRLEYSRDLAGLTKSGDDSQLYTKLYVYGANDANGNITSIGSVNGGREYIFDDEANDKYNNGDAYLEGYIVNDTLTSPTALLDWGKSIISKLNHPRFNYNVDVSHLGYKPNLGDHFQIVDFSMEPELTILARAIQIDESEANPMGDKVIVGEFVEVNTVTPELILDLQARAKKAQEAAEQAKNYNIQYFSPDGLDFSEGSKDKRIIIRVYLGKDDVTSTIDLSQFIWEKINPDGTYDDAWSESQKGIGNVITVGSEVVGCVVRCKIDDGNIPNIAIYFKNGINYVLDELSQIQNDYTLSIVFITDTHYATSSTNGNNLKSRSTMHMQNVSYLTNKVKIDAVAHGGDLIDGNEPKKLMMTDLEDAAKSIHSYLNAPLLFLVGNHDDNSWYSHDKDGNLMRSVIQPSERYNVFKKYLDPTIVQNVDDKESMYYYKDFPTQKVRMICLNSFDNPYSTMPDGTNKYPSQYQTAFRNTQLNWFANTALKLPTSEWGVLIFTHAPLEGTFSTATQTNSSIVYGILDAFMNGTSYSGISNVVDYTCNVSCNFSTQGKGEVIAVISGHVHYDGTLIKNGMRCIQTICSLARNDYAGRMPDRPLVSLLEDAWDVFTIDRSKRKLFATRFGAGISRSFDY